MLVVVIVIAPALTAFFGLAAYVVLLVSASLIWLCMMKSWCEFPQPALAVALLIRLFMFWTEPVLSDDVWRYLWDARVTASGVNPYLYSPDATELAHLRTSWHGEINHAHIRSIYPPYAEMSFLISLIFGGGIFGWRLVIFAADLGIIFLLRGSDRRAAMLWALCPIVIWEGMWNLHVDILAALMIVVAWRWSLGGRSWAAGFASGVAAGVKITPAAMIPSIMKGTGRRARYLTGFGTALVLAGIPLLFSPAFMSGAGVFAKSWSFNSPLYEMTSFMLERSGLAARTKEFWEASGGRVVGDDTVWWLSSLIYPEMMARAILAIAGVIVIAGVARRLRPEQSAPLAFAALLFFSPTIHPWYWLPALPLAILAGADIVVLFALFSGASYLMYLDAAVWLVWLLAYGVPVGIEALRRFRETKNHPAGWKTRRTPLRHE